MQGTVTLLDFATVAEAHEATVHSWESESGAVQQEIDKLRAEYPVDLISTKDPRLRDLGLIGSSVVEALANELHAEAHKLFPRQASEALTRVAAVRNVLRKIETEKLEESLLHLIRTTMSDRYIEAITMRLGWDGLGGTTLEEAAKIAGVTRERVRQIQKRLKEELSAVTYLPALDRAIATLDQAAETFEQDAALLLRREGVVYDSFLPAGVVSAAEMLNRSYRFEIGSDKTSVQLPSDTKAKSFKQALLSLSNVNHIASVLELQQRVYEIEAVEPSLESIMGCCKSLSWASPKRSVAR